MSVFPLQALFGKGMGWSSFFQKRVNKRSIWTGRTLRMTTLKVWTLYDSGAAKICARFSHGVSCWTTIVWGLENGDHGVRNQNQNILVSMQCWPNASDMLGPALSSGEMAVMKRWTVPSQGCHFGVVLFEHHLCMNHFGQVKIAEPLTESGFLETDDWGFAFSTSSPLILLNFKVVWGRINNYWVLSV